MARKIAAGVLAPLAVLALAAAVVWFVPVFSVMTIDVEGARATPEDEIVHATGVLQGENLVRVDEGAAARGVAALPWVTRATVRRSLPSTVRVTVEEREAVAFRDDGEGPMLVDTNGVPFLHADPPEGAVRIAGDPGSTDAKVEVAAALSPEVRREVTEVTGPTALEIELRLKDDRTIYWGANENNHDKALAARTVLGQGGSRWDVSNPALVTRR